MTPLGWLGRKTSTQTNKLRILYNSKFILMATSLRTNVVVVTRVHCIWTFYLAFSCYCYAIVLFKSNCLKIVSFIWDWTSLKTCRTSLLSLLLIHCRLNILSHTVYWKSLISILGMSGYEIYIFLEKKWLNYLQTVETLIRFCILRRLIWVCTVCQLPFYGSPDYNG